MEPLIPFLLAAIIATWIAFDGYRRGSPLGVVWAIVALFVLPVALPIHLATRPLKGRETREGGMVWNLLKNFALTWTACIAAAALFFIWIGSASSSAGTMLTVVSMVMLGMLWFFPMIVALMLGFFLRKPHVIERGPDAVREP